ncbi:MAG: methylenetetrahydrofolate--tRNA-(uracil(54)-C(5))-methyltransferase (FADH(2)-oxidizing) TrmFO [Syntrophomonadaceae bacterium]|nr:methylenetetrahydrofolate--tRNA-(uracil(54)-C(5))-methyltransferase (FADH(2)-oxidizing) TrmFO [Syntrophomonadaceae bacterium]
MKQWINVIGGGLAGSEAAYYLAAHGQPVRLWEMRPHQMTPVHKSGELAELVCSNSFKSELPDTAQGLLKQEMKLLGSLLLRVAEDCRVPAGAALAVDRERFARAVSAELAARTEISLVREEFTAIPGDEICIVATGPLTSDALAEHIACLHGEDNLSFFDAVAPTVAADSLDMDVIYRAARYDKGSDDYLNCPMDKEQYEAFHAALVAADEIEGHSVDKKLFFQGCMPVEFIARSGLDSLRYGPLRPVGLIDPRSGQRPWAVLQLRQENREGSLWGMVGFQTRIRWKEQQRIFRMIPGLERAEFVRYGVMHRNTFINAPRVLHGTLQSRLYPNLFFAGQLCGVEGYMESAASGILAAVNALRHRRGQELVTLPETSMLGALLRYISTENRHFQPMNANFGLLAGEGTKTKNKKERYRVYAESALQAMNSFVGSI